ncbi:MAG: FtsX-like permease family protein [Schleiferiaceae bacterium]|nr:FtsX-like permease family protein [Schleiferiaceae bacterium]
MNFPFFIAKRYLFSRHTTNAVNIITGISVLGVAVGAAAMIIVLSAFNGLETLIRGFYNTFDPDFKIELAEGKNIPFDEEIRNEIIRIPHVENCSYVLEEKALLRANDREFIATLKGVDHHYLRVTDFEHALAHGEFFPSQPEEDLAILGSGVAYHLGISKINMNTLVEVFVPKADANILDPSQAVNTRIIYPIGIFSIQPDFDVKYTVVPINLVQQLVDISEPRFSSLEVKAGPEADLPLLEEELQQTLGNNFKVLNRDEQQVSIYKVLKTEGLATYLILAFILMVSSFGILGANIMLVLDKKEDIKTLWALGADEKLVRKIFFTEGILTSFVGGIGGLILGTLIVMLQKLTGIISLGDGYVVEAYPVELRWSDFSLVLITVVILGILVSVISTQKLKKKNLLD